MANSKREEDILKLIENPLKAGDTFKFRCNQCGECCKDRDDILLSPYDLCRLSLELGLSIPEILGKYCDIYTGGTSCFPIVSLIMSKTRGTSKVCPFLQDDNRCQVHKSKPTVCAIYPLGRFAAPKQSKIEVGYFLQAVDCGYKDEEHTPKEWVGNFNLKESEEWFLSWQDAVMEISELTRKYLPIVSINIGGHMLNAIFNIMYLRYHPDKPVIPQVKENHKIAMNMLKEFESLLTLSQAAENKKNGGEKS